MPRALAANDDTDDCPECEGSGRITYYVGTYGTYSCHGPAEKRCPECRGTGVSDYA